MEHLFKQKKSSVSHEIARPRRDYYLRIDYCLVNHQDGILEAGDEM